MKNSIIIGIISFVLGCIVMYFIRKVEPIIIPVPITIEVPVPGVKDSFPYAVPFPKPYPVPNPTNKALAKELAEAKSQIDSLKILIEFTKPRYYTKTFKDTIQSIKVDMIATGSVDSVKVDYDIFDRTVKVDTTIYIKVPKQASIWVKASLLMPFQESKLLPSLKPGLMYIPKKGNLAYDAEVDFINKGVEVGLNYKF